MACKICAYTSCQGRLCNLDSGDPCRYDAAFLTLAEEYCQLMLDTDETVACFLIKRERQRLPSWTMDFGIHAKMTFLQHALSSHWELLAYIPLGLTSSMRMTYSPFSRSAKK